MTDPSSQWHDALDEVLRDMDSFADWLSGHCMRVKVDSSAVERIRRYVATGRPDRLGEFAIADILHLLMTGDADDMRACRHELRLRYSAQHSEQVAKLVWAAQDAAADNARNLTREMAQDEARAPL